MTARPRRWDDCHGDPCTCPKPSATRAPLVSAIPDADRKLRRIRELAQQWAALTHWDYKGPEKLARARADSANDAARILLNVLDGGDLL